MRKHDVSLLSQIEEDVVSGRPLADTLRKCIILGGKAGSQDLRVWALRELKGYSDSGDEPPAYRTVAAPILADAVTGNSWVTRQRIGASGLPEFVRNDVDEEMTLRHGVGQLEAIIAQASEKGYVDFSLPMAVEIGRIIDHNSGNRFQHIHAIYWSVSSSALSGIVDQIRTTLTELVAEIRALLTDDDAIPTAAAADQAVSVAVHGRRSNITVTTAQATAGATALAAPPTEHRVSWWTRSRIIGAGVAGVASIAGLLFAIAQWRDWL